MHKTDSKKVFGYIRSAVAAMLVAAIAALSLGCSFLSDVFKPDVIRFKQRELILSVGESYDITRILETNTTVYRLKTSDSAVVAVDKGSNTGIKAVAEGEAKITAATSSASASILVTVTEKVEDSLVVSASGELVQTLGDTSEVTFTINAKGNPSKSESALWYVNDKLSQTLDLSARFEFTPSEVGEYTVVVKCGDFTSNAITVRVYNVVTAEVSVSGELEQSEPFSDIVFSVDASGADDMYYQYFEDGKVLYEGNSGTYVYTPTAGRHTLTVKVNGQTEYSEQAIFRGAILPTVGGLSFDNLYPHAYISYDAVGKVKVEITSPQGGAAEYSQTDSRYADLFDENRFDVGTFIDLCATGANRQEYKFRVKSLGDDDAITESEYSDFVTFTQLPANAKQYVTNVLPCGDLYVTSDIEYVSIAQYYIYFRKKQAKAKVSFDCYIGYNRLGSANDLWNSAHPIAATSGNYSEIRVSDSSGGVMHTEFTVDTVNNPSTQTDESGQRSEQLHIILPHINMDAAKNRPSNYEFAIDRRTRTAEVTYSDELYLAAQYGVKPLPKAKSSAQAVYEQAKSVLRSICTDDMTDVQKAHAICDWIMWHVTYDTPATHITEGGESLSAYYLEGVFGDGTTTFDGVAYNPNAVCDGMSKAYALMCNIEGIPCVRVVGRAGEDVNSAGGHAWNKVFLNGAWYFVDCTWGDSSVTFGLDGPERKYELGMHNYLFKTDAQVAATHFEPYKYKDTLRYAPRTAKSPINVFADITVNGVAINCYIAKNEIQRDRLSEIATAFARAYQKGKTISVPLSGEHTVDYQAIEVCAEDGFTLSSQNITSVVANAVRSVNGNATVRTLTLEDSILILIKE